MAISFDELLALARAGERAALEQLLARWRPLLRLEAGVCLGPELSARVEDSDVVQEALAQAFQHLQEFRGQSEAEWVGWLRSMVAGHAAKLRRHHHAQKRDLERDTALPATIAAGPAGAPVEQAIDRERAARLAAAVDALPQAMRDVVVRRVFYQEPFDAVARALGRSPGSARVLWTRALRRLRQSLATD